MPKSCLIAIVVLSAALTTPAYAQMSGTLAIARPSGRTAAATVKTYNLRSAWPIKVAISNVVFARATKDGFPAGKGPGRVSLVLSDPAYVAALRANRSTPIVLQLTCQGRRGLVRYTIAGARVVSMQPNVPIAAGQENMHHEFREHVSFTYQKIY